MLNQNKMGCDIHMYAEYKDINRNQWFCVGRLFDKDWISKDIPRIDSDGYEYNARKVYHPYSSRNYTVFSILADVRNEDEIIPISQPKGLPDDVTDFVKKELINDYYHSLSYLSLQELLDYNWKQKIKKLIFVSKEQAEDYQERGIIPQSRCGWTNNPKSVQIEIEIAIKDDIGQFKKTLKTLKALAKEVGGNENLRIVFGFNN